MDKFIFFDRDGVVNKRLVGDYVKSIEEFEFSDGFFGLFKSINEKGYKTALITNQQGVNKGIMTENELEIVHTFMQSELIKNTGFGFDYIKFSTDLDKTNSPRRKPALGMFIEVIEEHKALNKIDIENSYMIGDSITDILPANIIGLNTVFIGSNEEFEKQKTLKYDKLKSEVEFIFSLSENMQFIKNNTVDKNIEKNIFQHNYIFESISSINNLVSLIFN